MFALAFWKQMLRFQLSAAHKYRQDRRIGEVVKVTATHKSGEKLKVKPADHYSYLSRRARKSDGSRRHKPGIQ